MGRRFGFWLGNLAVTVAFVAGAAWVVLHRQDMVDWWRLRQYQPPAAIVQLADSTGMYGRGRDLFYVSDPQVQNKQEFNDSCHNSHNEESLVLGCYTLQRIYIYNVDDPRLAGVKEVTAAHEMLHAAYERLNSKEKSRINKLLDAQIQANQDQRIAGLIELYNRQEPGQLHNEMHSILGTEAASLSPELEEYYKRYFTDRQKIVAYSQKYEGVLSASKERIAQMEAELSALKAKIDSQNQSLNRQEAELHAQANQMGAWRNAGNITAYNAAVPGYNTKVREFNALVEATRGDIARYNQLVEQHNQEVAAQSGLYQSLDSNYQPVQTN